MKVSRCRNICRIARIVMAGAALVLLAGCQQAQQPNAVYPPSASPRLVELGASICVPCAMMRPGLDEIKKEYAGQLEVEVIDTLRHPGAKKQYNAPYCATQIYISASGQELYRHVGYSSKKDILARWKELGVDLAAAESIPPAGVTPKESVSADEKP